MIRTFSENDLFAVMQIWLDANIKAHSFIPKDYWTDNYAMVKEILPQAEIYVCEDSDTNQIDGFIGLTDNYTVKRYWKTTSGFCKRNKIIYELKRLSKEYPCNSFLSKRTVCNSFRKYG